MRNRIPGGDRDTEAMPAVEATAERTRRRFVRRQWARRWIGLRYVVAGVLLVVGVVLGVWLLFFSRVLDVESVAVDGAQLVSDHQVRAAAGVPSGEPLARVDLDAVDARVESLVEVRAVEVSRSWPDGILITIQERVAIAVVDVGGELRGMDAEGVLFRDYATAPPTLPRVTMTAGVRREAMLESARVISALPASLARRVDHVEVETVDAISLVLRDDRSVIWGSAAASEEKARVLDALLDATKARVYDVSVPGQPTTRN